MHTRNSNNIIEVSSPGDAKEPTDKYAVDDDDDDDDFECDDEKRRAKASLDVFFAKVLRLAALRLMTFVPASTSAKSHRHAFQICEFVVFEKTSLLYNRHLDQIILASIYGACKISSNEQDRNVKFKDIVYRYHTQPQCVEEVFWSCPLTVTNPGLEIVNHGRYRRVLQQAVCLACEAIHIYPITRGESERSKDEIAEDD